MGNVKKGCFSTYATAQGCFVSAKKGMYASNQAIH
jgi:hypothetical protein